MCTSKDPFLEKNITPAENTDWEILYRGVLQMAINAGSCRMPKMESHDWGGRLRHEFKFGL